MFVGVAVEQPDVQAAIAVLLKKLGLENSSGSLAQKLALAKRVLAEQVIPAVNECKLQESRGSKKRTLAFLDASQYPLGFSMGGVPL